MRIVSINVGQIGVLTIKEKPVRSAILKHAIDGPARIGRLGVQGDHQADPRFHGGPEQALNVYPSENYLYWKKALGIEPAYGTFGENLTTEGLAETEVCVGDIFRFGTVRAQATKPRIPCYKLEAVIGVPGFEWTCAESGRTGFYLRILEEGEARAGDPIALERRDPAGLTMRNLFGVMMGEPVDPATLRRGLDAEGLSEGLRGKIEKALQAAESA